MHQKIIIMIGLLLLLTEIGLENPMPGPAPLEEDEMLARIL
jgi:hypothetical protein